MKNYYFWLLIAMATAGCNIQAMEVENREKQVLLTELSYDADDEGARGNPYLQKKQKTCCSRIQGTAVCCRFSGYLLLLGLCRCGGMEHRPR